MEVHPKLWYLCTTVHGVVFHKRVISNLHVFRKYISMSFKNLKALKCSWCLSLNTRFLLINKRKIVTRVVTVASNDLLFLPSSVEIGKATRNLKKGISTYTQRKECSHKAAI
jgi:hypothetical protein